MSLHYCGKAASLDTCDLSLQLGMEDRNMDLDVKKTPWSYWVIHVSMPPLHSEPIYWVKLGSTKERALIRGVHRDRDSTPGS